MISYPSKINLITDLPLITCLDNWLIIINRTVTFDAVSLLFVCPMNAMKCHCFHLAHEIGKDENLDFSKFGLWSEVSSFASIPTVLTTMFPKEQQTSDNLIIKDYCFIIEIFDKCSFSGIFRGCLSHLNET